MTIENPTNRDVVNTAEIAKILEDKYKEILDLIKNQEDIIRELEGASLKFGISGEEGENRLKLLEKAKGVYKNLVDDLNKTKEALDELNEILKRVMEEDTGGYVN